MQQSSRIKYQRQQKHAHTHKQTDTHVPKNFWAAVIKQRRGSKEQMQNEFRLVYVCVCVRAVCLCFIFALSSCCCEQYPLFLLCMLIVFLSFTFYVLLLCVFVNVCVSARLPVLYALLNICQFSKITCFLWPPTTTHTYTDTRVHRLTHTHIQLH